MESLVSFFAAPGFFALALALWLTVFSFTLCFRKVDQRTRWAPTAFISMVFGAIGVVAFAAWQYGWIAAALLCVLARPAADSASEFGRPHASDVRQRRRPSP